MADQVIDTELLRKSVTADEVKAARQTYMWFGSFLLPTPLITLPPDPPAYYTRAGDQVLLGTVASEDKWANAISIAATKCASLEYDIEGDVPLRRNRMHDILTAVDGMQGWGQFIAKQMQDFLCTNNGEFVEVVRASRAVGSRVVGLLHLDSTRCYRTGDPEIPVIYMDRLGRLHELRAHQVIAIADMPTPRLTFNGVGFCAAQRVYRTIYRMAAIEQYIAEKVTGRRPLKVTLINGLTQKQLEQVFASADQDASAKGLTSYMGAAVSAVPTDEDISTVEIELSGLPENFDLEKERLNANLTYANTIGLDIQDLQPGAIGGSLGSSTQSQVLNDKAKGKGLAYWRRAFTEQLNLKVLPDATVFMFIEKDYRDEMAKADAASARQAVRSQMISDGMIDPQQALQMAADEGDVPSAFLDEDTTPAGTISSDEKPMDTQADTQTDTQGDDAQNVQPPAEDKQQLPVPPQARPAEKEAHIDPAEAFASAFKSYSLKAYRTELVTIKPALSKMPADRADVRAYYERVTKEVRAYLKTLAAKCRELCPVDEGVTRASIRPEVISPDTSWVRGVLYVGNKSRPEVAIRSVLYGRRGFGPKTPGGVLAFETKDGNTVFTTHVAATDPNNWFAQAWKETEPQRRAMSRRIGQIGREMIEQRDVRLVNAAHIDGFDPSKGDTVPNTAVWRRRGGMSK